MGTKSTLNTALDAVFGELTPKCSALEHGLDFVAGYGNSVCYFKNYDFGQSAPA
jgi:hypothetical protein